MNTISCNEHRSHDDIDHRRDSDHRLTLIRKNHHRGSMSLSSSAPLSRRGRAKDSLAGPNDATAMKTASASPPPSLSQSAKRCGSSHYDAQPKKHSDRFGYGCHVRPRLLFIMLLLLLTGSCDGMKNTSTHDVLPMNNTIHPMHHENSLHDAYDDHRMVTTTETLIEHDRSWLLQQNCVYNESDLTKAMSLNRTEIDLCSSHISIYSSIAAVSKYVSFTCNLKVTNGVKCILDAQQLSRHFNAYNATLYFYDIVFINGNVSHYGGAIYMTAHSKVSMSRCDFMNNFAPARGGAIVSYDSTLILKGGKAKVSVVENNQVMTNSFADGFGIGGFLYASNSIISITNHLFGNNGAHGYGGAIFIEYSSLSTYRCDFMNNGADGGGAIYSRGSTLILTGREAKASVAESSAAYFGAFLYAESSIITITNHLFRNNYAATYGGAIEIFQSSLSTYRCDFINNFAVNGGGAISSDNSNLILTGGNANASVAENNGVGQDGFGGFLFASNSIINITNHLFRNNYGGYGGANFHLQGSNYYENATFQNNAALKQGGVLVIGFEAMTLRNVVFKDNDVINGAIRSFSSQLDLKNLSFLSSDPTMGPCNLFVKELNTTIDAFSQIIDLTDIAVGSRESCINFPTLVSINNRRLDTKSIQANNHELPTIVDPNDQMHPIDHLFLTTNTSSENQLSMPYNMSPQRMLSSSTCVTSSASLRNAVQSAKPGTKTTIKVCTSKIYLGPHARRLQYGNGSLLTNILDGIDISNKNIVFVCSRKSRRNAPCTLDAGGVTRHFYGSDSKVQFRNIRFINGYHQGAGGALMINNSDVNLMMCFFSNNTALSGGGAVFVNQTRLVINGTKTNVSQNGGSGAPIEVHSSTATLHNVAFADNNFSQFGDGIFMFDSDVDLSNLRFNQSSSNVSSDCNLFVSIDPSNRTANATCVAL